MNQQMTTLFTTLLQQLPEEIRVNCIAPYTYRPQLALLCKDIQQFVTTRRELINVTFDLIVRNGLHRPKRKMRQTFYKKIKILLFSLSMV